MSELDHHINRQTDGMEFQMKSTGGLLPFARFKAEENNLHFNWLEEARQENQSTNALRNTILDFEGGGRKHFILLRDLHVSEPKPFDLTNRLDNKVFRPLVRDDYKRRELLLSWADENALKGSRWKLCIRKWTIVSRLSGSAESIVIAKGNDEEKLTPKVESDIIQGQVKIEIEIAPEALHIVRIRFRFYPDMIISKRNERSKILEELVELKKKDRTTDRDKQIKRIENDEKNNNVVDNLYNHLLHSNEASLSLIVSLVINDESKTVIDVAKFGEFAIRQP